VYYRVEFDLTTETQRENTVNTEVKKLFLLGGLIKDIKKKSKIKA
jgi:hypothetical protein